MKRELVSARNLETATLFELYSDSPRPKGANIVIVKMIYLTAVCIFHDKAQAVMCLERVFQSLHTENENSQSRTW